MFFSITIKLLFYIELLYINHLEKASGNLPTCTFYFALDCEKTHFAANL